MISAGTQSACDNAIRTARRGDTRSGIGLARHAYRLARHESLEAELDALNALGLCQSANGSFIESIATSIDAFRLARQIGHRAGAAFALSTMAGSASFILDANDVVLEMLHYCLAEAIALNDAPLQVRTHLTYGLVYGILERFDEADAEYDRALALVETAGARAALITPGYLISGNKAYLAVQRHRSAGHGAGDNALLEAEAEKRVAYVLGVARAERNIDAEARAYYCLGQLRTQQGRISEALAAFDETLERAERIRHNPRLIDTHIEIARIHAAAGKQEDALQALERAYEIADANRPSSKIATICRLIAECYERLGRERDAAHYAARNVRESEAFQRENELTVRDLNAFWRPLAAGTAA